MNKTQLKKYAYLLVDINIKEHLNSNAMNNCLSNPCYTLMQSNRILNENIGDWLKEHKYEKINLIDQSYILYWYYKRKKELNLNF